MSEAEIIARLHRQIKDLEEQRDALLFTYNQADKECAELQAEIERWKVQHEEMLLKHAKDQGVALSALEAALKEIERLKLLLIRAADVIGNWNVYSVDEKLAVVAQLRKAIK